MCGSPGEVANDPQITNVFTSADNSKYMGSHYFMKLLLKMMIQIIFYYFTAVGFDYPEGQKSDVWNMIALQGDDQLRQRMAWALSQILVVTPKQVNIFNDARQNDYE